MRVIISNHFKRDNKIWYRNIVYAKMRTKVKENKFADFKKDEVSYGKLPTSNLTSKDFNEFKI